MDSKFSHSQASLKAVSLEYATDYIKQTGSRANLQLIREASVSLKRGGRAHCSGWRDLDASQRVNYVDP